jgi:hypothetical protein
MLDPSLDARLADLLVEWELQRDLGSPVTPEDLCRESPDLIEPPRQRIARLSDADRLLGTSAPVPGG